MIASRSVRGGDSWRRVSRTGCVRGAGTVQRTPERTGFGPLLAVAVAAGGGLAAEVLLAGAFSVLFSSAWAYLAVAIALFGTGAGAFWASRQVGTAVPPRWWLYWAGSMVLAVLVLHLWRDANVIAVYVATAALVFYWPGAVVARCYVGGAPEAVYVSDVLAGVAGLVLGVALLAWVGAFRGLVLLAVLPLAAGTGMGSVRRGWPLAATWAAVAVLGGVAAAVPLHPPFRALRGVSPAKTLVAALRLHPGAPMSQHWSTFGLTTLVGSGRSGRKMLFIDGGSGSYIYAADQASAVARGIVGFAERWSRPRTVLDLGAGGGADVAAALALGARSVTAVEIDPAVRPILLAQAPFDGRIADRPGVRYVTANARRFAAGARPGAYGLVLLDLVTSQAAQPGSLALAGSYVFTTQALQQDLRLVSPRGALAVIAHQVVEGSRVLFTGVRATMRDRRMGAAESLLHWAMAAVPTTTPEARPTIVLYRQRRFSRAAATRLGLAMGRAGLVPVYLPYVYPNLLSGLAEGKIGLRAFLRGSAFNYFPVTDNRPFFFLFTPGVPRSAWVALAVGGALAGLLLLWRRRGEGGPPLATSLIAGLTGMAFLLVEVACVERFVLLLGGPTSALSAGLGGMLLGAGLGAVRWRPGVRGALASAALAVSLILVLSTWVAPLGLHVGAAESAVVACALLTCLSAGLGLPLPSLLRTCPAACRPRLFSENAAGSVVGAVLAMVLGVAWGFAGVLAVALGLYLVGLALAGPWPAGRRGRPVPVA